MTKVFLDSSVVFAAAGSQTGGSFKIISLIKEGKLEGWVNEGVVAESEEAIGRNLSKEKYKLFVTWLEKDYFEILPFPKEKEILKLEEIDTKDRHIILSAIDSGSDYLISLDRKHILTEGSQKAVPNIKIVTPKDFLRNHFK